MRKNKANGKRTDVDSGRETNSRKHGQCYKLMNVWEGKEIPMSVSFAEREEMLTRQCALDPNGDFPSPLCTAVTPMPWHEEMIVVLLWLALFALVLWGPLLLIALFYFRSKVALIVTTGEHLLYTSFI
jgi:hypothetical protein